MEEVDPIQSLYIATMASVIVPAITSLNHTVFSAINLNNICHDIRVVDGILDDLPDVDNLSNILNSVNSTAYQLSIGIDVISADIRFLDDQRLSITSEADNLIYNINAYDYSLQNISVALNDTNNCFPKGFGEQTELLTWNTWIGRPD